MSKIISKFAGIAKEILQWIWWAIRRSKSVQGWLISIIGVVVTKLGWAAPMAVVGDMVRELASTMIDSTILAAIPSDTLGLGAIIAGIAFVGYHFANDKAGDLKLSAYRQEKNGIPGDAFVSSGRSYFDIKKDIDNMVGNIHRDVNNDE